MTDTNENKETFEDWYNHLWAWYPDYKNDFAHIVKLKQLHDQALIEQSKKDAFVFTEEMQKLSLDKDKRIENITTASNFVAYELNKKLKEKDEEISELQIENIKLKNHIKRCVDKIEINGLKKEVKQ
jgi:hypothetical protein